MLNSSSLPDLEKRLAKVIPGKSEEYSQVIAELWSELVNIRFRNHGQKKICKQCEKLMKILKKSMTGDAKRWRVIWNLKVLIKMLN